MNLPAHLGPRWSTACLSAGSPAVIGEPGALEQHLGLCLGRRRRLFVLRCGADTLQAFVTARVISTVALLAVPVVLAAWLW